MEVWKLKFESSYEGYNFVVGSPSIKVHVKKVMSLQSCGTHNLGTFEIPKFWEFEKNNHFNVVLTWRSKIYYRGGGGDLLPSLGHTMVYPR
jgi:hypothetical protein